MKTLQQLMSEALQEKQRFAKEKGQKFDTFQQFAELIKEYEARDDLFLFAQYSDVNKLGLNPSSTYKTPLGIYGYPAILFGAKSFEAGKVPFAGDRKFIIVYTVASDAIKQATLCIKKSQYLDAHAGMSDSAFNQASDKLVKAFPDLKPSLFPDSLWLQSRKAAKEEPRKWAQVLMQVGVEGVVDQGAGVIHPHEMTQAVFFRASSLKHLLTIDNPAIKRKPIETWSESDIDAIYFLIGFDPYTLEHEFEIPAKEAEVFRYVREPSRSKVGQRIDSWFYSDEPEDMATKKTFADVAAKMLRHPRRDKNFKESDVRNVTNFVKKVQWYFQQQARGKNV
jgi:hypothetical protein